MTKFVHLICLQHVRCDAARRAGLSASADPCSYSCAAVDKISTEFERRAVPLRYWASYIELHTKAGKCYIVRPTAITAVEYCRNLLDTTETADRPISLDVLCPLTALTFLDLVFFGRFSIAMLVFDASSNLVSYCALDVIPFRKLNRPSCRML